MAQGWRKLQFFEKAPRDADPSLLGVICTDYEPTATHLILADMEGAIRFLDEALQVVHYFHAYLVTCSHLAYNKSKNLLITLGVDDEGGDGTLKFWDLSQWDDEGIPDLFQELPVGSSYLITCFSVSADLSQIAVGAMDGTLITFSGNFYALPDIHRREYKVKGGNPIAGLAFAQRGRPLLYVATSAIIRTYRALAGELNLLADVEKRDGAALQCSSVDAQGKYVVGRKEGLTVYDGDAVDLQVDVPGEKIQVLAIGKYVVVVNKADESRRCAVSILSLAHQFLALHTSFINVESVVQCWDQVLVIANDGQWFSLTERTTEKKMEILFRRNLFQIALVIAADGDNDSSAGDTAEIFKKFGDNLYSKGDYDSAMEQYLQTVGDATIEPSSIIKKFLESQHNRNLTRYLEALHDKGIANENHTTLLLTCYTKLKEYEKLRSFIQRPGLEFDVEAAIHVCREAGYYEYSLDLAKARQAHEWYVKLLIQDFNRHEDALQFLSELPPYEISKSLIRASKELLVVLEEETTAFLINLFTLPFGDGQANVFPLKSRQALLNSTVSIFVGRPHRLMQLLEAVVQKIPKVADQELHSTLLDLYLRDFTSDVGTPTNKEERRKKASAMLSAQELLVDLNQALVLCQLYNYSEGTLILYERLHLGNEICQLYMEMHEYAKLVLACNKFGKSDSKLWSQALRYFAQLTDPASSQYLQELLNGIRKYNAVPPIQVLEIMSSSKGEHTLAVVQTFLVSALTETKKQLEDDSSAVISHIVGNAKASEQIEQLRSSAVEFAPPVGMDLPTVHFLSGHTYSLSELPNEDTNPAIANQYQSLINRQQQLQASAQNHSEFFRQLEGAENGFSVIATYLGRGLFDKQEGTASDLQLPTLEPDLFADLGLSAI